MIFCGALFPPSSPFYLREFTLPIFEYSESEEYISIKEETILEEKKFDDIFEISASLSLSMATA